MITRLTLLSLAAASAASAQALVPLPVRGEMAAFPVATVWSHVPDTIVEKMEGARAPLELMPTEHPYLPDMSTLQIRSRLALQADLTLAEIPPLEIDAMSSFNDLLPLEYVPGATPADDEYWLSVGNVDGWATLMLAMDTEDDNPPGVYGIYFDNPAFPAQLQNGGYHEWIYSEISGSPAVPAPDPQNRDQVVAMDLAMGLMEAAESEPDRTVVPHRDRLYFTLTEANAAQLSTALANDPLIRDNSATYVPPHTGPIYTGSTIFVAMFDDQGDCEGVFVHADWNDLLLSSQDEDIDGLAMCYPPPIQTPRNGAPLTRTEFQYVISTVAGATQEPEELMVVGSPSNPPNPGPVRRKGRLRHGTGDRIIGAGGTMQGFVRGICSQDPEVGGHGGIAYGEPWEDGGYSYSMNLSLAVRQLHLGNGDQTSSPPPGDNFRLTGTLSGWAGVPADSLVYLKFEILNPPFPNYPPVMISLPLRQAADDVYDFSVPFYVPWLTASAWNNYRFSVVQADVATMTTVTTCGSLVSRQE